MWRDSLGRPRRKDYSWTKGEISGIFLLPLIVCLSLRLDDGSLSCRQPERYVLGIDGPRWKTKDRRNNVSRIAAASPKSGPFI